MKNINTFLLLLLSFILFSCSGQPKLYSVGGSVTGLNGTLTLQNNGADDLVITVDGSFTFATKVADGGAYAVTVKQGPTTQNCAVTNGSGTISGAGVTNVLVSCTNKAWHRPANLTDHLSVAGTGAYGPRIALNSAGDAVVVWHQEDGSGNLQVYKAELKGGSWSLPADLADHLSVAGTNAYDPRVALNAAGDVIVVWWQEYGNGIYQVYKAERQGGNWSTPANLDDYLSMAGTSAAYPQVALNDAGDAVVVWKQHGIYKAERRRGSWNMPANIDDHLSPGGTGADSPQVAMNAAGDAVVVWMQDDGGNYLQIYKAEFHAGSWSKPTDLDDHLSVGGTHAYSPQVALNTAGDAVVVWWQSDGSFNQAYKAERHGGNWTVPTNLDDHLSFAGTHASSPQVALNAAGNAVVVWVQYDGNDSQVYKAERQDSSLNTPTSLADHLSIAGTNASSPQVALNAAGDAVMLWVQFDGSSNLQVYKAEHHGGSWTVPTNLDDHLSLAGTDASDAQVALNTSGDAVVVWQQKDGNGDSQIYKAEYR